MDRIKMEDGKWKMENGRWKMEDGRWMWMTDKSESTTKTPSHKGTQRARSSYSTFGVRHSKMDIVSFSSLQAALFDELSH
jgi:hypothetical protein